MNVMIELSNFVLSIFIIIWERGELE